jgi:hypothetical protein
MATADMRRAISGCWVLIMLTLTACGQFQTRYQPYSPGSNDSATERGGGDGGGGGNSM